MRNVYSVSQVNSYIKNMFTQDFMLNRIQVSGEISNCKYHSSGHIYFSLKDEKSSLSCVMFAGDRKGLAFSMKDGDNVIVDGSISVYERDGRYQLYAKEVKLSGAGLLYERFLALKQELEEMGMFAQEYKQPIPRYIRTLGVVTAPTGAVIQDIRNVTHRRNPYIQIILYPALVQGEGAAESIANGIERLDRYGVDLMIVGRGGGSIEDLWAFNEERVARAIFNCSTPVISAVGHETDTTIADYVADMRAPTPSAAAELAAYDFESLTDSMRTYRRRLQNGMGRRLILVRTRLTQESTKLQYLSPENQIREKRQRLVDLEDAFTQHISEKLTLRRQKYREQQQLMEDLMRRRMQLSRHRLDLAITRMEGLSPLHKLRQGYSYMADDAGVNVRSVDQVKPGDTLHIQVTDGEIQSVVKTCTKMDRGE